MGSVFKVTQLVFYRSIRGVFKVTQLVFYFRRSGQIAIYKESIGCIYYYIFSEKAICPVLPKENSVSCDSISVLPIPLSAVALSTPLALVPLSVVARSTHLRWGLGRRLARSPVGPWRRSRKRLARSPVGPWETTPSTSSQLVKVALHPGLHTTHVHT